MLRSLPLVLCLACAGAHAHTVYRCSIDGKTSYSDTPCASGTSTALETPAAPSAASPAPDLARMKAESATLEKQRHAREAKDERAQGRDAARAAARRQQCDKLRLNKKWAEEDAAHATGQAVARARVKARRMAEQLALECPG